MTAVLEGVQTASVEMTPNQTVAWQRHDLEHGRLYLSSTCPPDVAGKVIDMAWDDSQAFRELHIKGGGEYGQVRTDGQGTAFKKFLDIGPEEVVGLSMLQVNVGMEHGLRAIKQSEMQDRTIRRGRLYDIRTPEYHAGFFPYSRPHPLRQHVKPLVAMSFEPGFVAPRWIDLPTTRDRTKRFDAAMKAVGFDPSLIDYDDGLKETTGAYDNFIVHPDSDDTTLRLVMLDAIVAEDNAAAFAAQF